VTGALSELSPKRAKIPFFFGGCFISSFNPTSSKVSSCVGRGSSNWTDLLTADLAGVAILDSKLCLGVMDPCAYTGERAEISYTIYQT
jgi:hypothetical protein